MAGGGSLCVAYTAAPLVSLTSARRRRRTFHTYLSGNFALFEAIQVGVAPIAARPRQHGGQVHVEAVRVHRQRACVPIEADKQDWELFIRLTDICAPDLCK